MGVLHNVTYSQYLTTETTFLNLVLKQRLNLKMAHIFRLIPKLAKKQQIQVMEQSFYQNRVLEIKFDFGCV